MRTNITLKIAVAGALYACSCFASTFGVATILTCPSFTGFGSGALATSTWQTCGPVSQFGSTVTIDTTTSANNYGLDIIQGLLSPQSVSSQDGITPVEGGALKTTFTSSAGTLSFNYSFFSEPAMASFGFMLLDGTQYDLGHNTPAPAVFTATIPLFEVAIGAGSHNIAFGMMNGITGAIGPTTLDPTLTISNLDAPAAGIPEAATFGLVAGAFALAFTCRRYSQASRS